MHADVIFQQHLAEGEDRFFRHHDLPQPPIPPNQPNNGDPVYPAYNQIKSQLRRIKTHQQWITDIVPQYQPHVAFLLIRRQFRQSRTEMHRATADTDYHHPTPTNLHHTSISDKDPPIYNQHPTYIHSPPNPPIPDRESGITADTDYLRPNSDQPTPYIYPNRILHSAPSKSSNCTCAIAK